MNNEYFDFAVRLNNGEIVTCEQYDEISKSPDPELKKMQDDFSLVYFDHRGTILSESPMGAEHLHKYLPPKREKVDDDEIRRLYEELQSDLNLKQPTKDEILAELCDINSQLEIYDYGIGEISNRQAISDFYGSALLSRIDEELEHSRSPSCTNRKRNTISIKLWQLMRDMRAGRKPAPWVPKPEKKKIQRENTQAPAQPQLSTPPAPEKTTIQFCVQKRVRQNGDGYFMKTERGLVRNESYREIFKGPGTVYEWLWANIVREQWKDTEQYPIKARYYDNGFLVYCSTFGQIAKACGMSKTTVHRYIKIFVEAGIVKTEKIIPKGKKQGQTVFIIGTWKMRDNKPVETYYRDQVFFVSEEVKK